MHTQSHQPVTITVATASGKMLDFLTGIALKVDVVAMDGQVCYHTKVPSDFGEQDALLTYAPQEDAALVWDWFERLRINLCAPIEAKLRTDALATIEGDPMTGAKYSAFVVGPNRMTAALRALVISQLGETVDLPQNIAEELSPGVGSQCAKCGCTLCDEGFCESPQCAYHHWPQSVSLSDLESMKPAAIEVKYGITKRGSEIVPIKVAVLAADASGSPTFCLHEVECTEEQINEGIHYEMAKDMCREQEYESPMIAFDATDYAARQGTELAAFFK